MSSGKDMAIRAASARERFIESIIEQFGKTQGEAEIITDVFVKLKAVKFCPRIGQAQLAHGGFWEMYAMDKALEMRREGKA